MKEEKSIQGLMEKVRYAKRMMWLPCICRLKCDGSVRNFALSLPATVLVSLGVKSWCVGYYSTLINRYAYFNILSNKGNRKINHYLAQYSLINKLNDDDGQLSSSQHPYYPRNTFSSDIQCIKSSSKLLWLGCLTRWV